MRQNVGRSVLLTILLLFAGTTIAQPGGPSASEAGAEEKQKELEEISKAGESLVDEDLSALSGQQKLDRGEEKINTSKKNLEEANRLLDEARQQEQDIQKINCINDKLAAIKGFLKVAEQSFVKLKSAASSGDEEEADHHYTLISVSNQKIQKLSEEARLCAGDAERYAEGTKVETNIDDDISDPPSYVPGKPGKLARLPELSPYQ